jgi:diamine N-acetyltransferase
LIHSEKIVIRETVEEDLDFVLNLEGHAEVSPYIIPWDRNRHKETINRNDKLHLIIEDADSELPVGYMIISGISDINNSLELVRIAIGPKRKGYGSEVFSLFLPWAFNTYSANRIWLDVKTTNKHAIHLYHKAGFTFEGTLRECIKTGNAYESLHIMSILKYEFLKKIKEKV